MDFLKRRTKREWCLMAILMTVTSFYVNENHPNFMRKAADSCMEHLGFCHDYDRSSDDLDDEGQEAMVESSFKVITRARVSVTQFGKTFETEVGGSGTGTAIYFDEHTEQLYILTCAHVLDFSGEDPFVKVEQLSMKCYLEHKGFPVPCTALFIDKESDIALIRTDWGIVGHDGPVIRDFAHSGDVDAGDVAYAVGYPFGVGPMMTSGVISNPDVRVTMGGGHFHLVMASPGISPGNSGGALYVLRDGIPHLVGMSQLTLGLNGVYGFISMSSIKIQFEKHGYGHILES